MKIINCRTNHILNPLGYLMEYPVFSYVVIQAQGTRQTYGRIKIATDSQMKQIIFDNKEENQNSLAVKVDLPLQPRTRYYWTVEAGSDANEVAISDVNWFETGKMNEPWKAKWIAAKKEIKRHPIFNKQFTLDGLATGKVLQDARLYISGLGVYQAILNEKDVSSADGLSEHGEKLTPYCNDYDQWIQYQTYDVTDKLQTPNNTFEITVGSGWYTGRFGFRSKPGDKGLYGDELLMIAELHVRYTDGTEELIISDESWSVTRSNITLSNIYDGEQVDDTLSATEPEEVIITVPKGALTARMSIPVLAHEEIPAVELLTTPQGEKVFDLGQNMAGVFRLHIDVPKGTVVHVQTGEVLQNGCFYRDNLRTALSEYYYISDGKPHDLIPQFTYYGYRYAKVEGVPNLKKEDFTGIEIYSDVTPTGKLVCGDSKINQLLSNINWGLKGNFVDVPTDCPQRDERMGWTADTQVFVPTACYLTDSTAFYRKFLYDLRQEQKVLNGAVPFVIPSCGILESCSVWGDAATIIPWSLFTYTGDLTILEESLPSMKAWVDYIKSIDDNQHNWRNVFHFGDWLALDAIGRKVDTVKGGTDDGYIADIYYMHSAEITAESAHLTGHEQDAEKYDALAKRIRQDILDEYFTKTGRCAITTQTGSILALRHHLTSDPEKTLDSLKKDIAARGNKLATGFVGTPFLNQELSAFNEDKLAYQLLHNEEYPGWLYEINLGATTVWERWNSMEEDGTVSSTGMNSFNHYAYGSIGEWMWKTIGGITPITAGFKRALLRPVADLKIGYSDATYNSASGTWKLSWKVIDPTHVSICGEVPFNCTAHLSLPYAKAEDAERELTAGEFSFSYELAESLETH